MSSLRFSFKQVFLFSILALFLLFLTEAILVYHVTKRNSVITTFTQEKEQPIAKLNSLYTKFATFHNCENNTNQITDSFYEIKIVNNSDTDFYNWKLTIPVQGDLTINKIMNANYELQGSTLIFTPINSYSNVIKAHSVTFIEIYLSHLDPLDYSSLFLTGNLVRHIGSYPLHIMIVIIGSLIILALIIYTLMYSYLKREINILHRITKKNYAIIDQTMKTFVNFIDAKDQYTRGHSTRVAEYSRIIAKRMGYDEQFQQDIYYMGLMHDIGKITVPDTILNKTSHLSADEWAVIQMHTSNGANLLKNFTVIPEIRDAVLYHHERYDGKGYLKGLKGEEIPLCARIICVADSFDAMNTNRCYRLKYSKERIIKEFERCSARQFDPTIASIMIELISDGTIN